MFVVCDDVCVLDVVDLFVGLQCLLDDDLIGCECYWVHFVSVLVIVLMWFGVEL